MELWQWIGIIVLASYVGVCVILYLIQDFFLFHPEKLLHNFRFEYDIPFEEVVIQGPSRAVINGLLFTVPNRKGVVFYFKGNTRSIKGWAKFAKDFTKKGYDFFLIDYPGFGKSSGQRSERIIYKNAQIAYLWLSDRYPESEITIYGRSLGSGFASRIAAWNNPKRLILDSPFYSFTELANYYTRIIPTRLLLKYKMSLYQDIEELENPTYIIHGSKDRVIPYSFSPRIQKITPERVKLFTIEGAKHNNLPEFEQYHQALKGILNDEYPLKINTNE